MSLLDSFSEQLQTGAVNSTVPRPMQPSEPGVFDNFASGAGRYFMRSMAETGRAIDLLGAVGPIAVDKITGGTERQDAYFREHDEVFQRAVDYWTPKPNEVGAAGQVVGQLAGGVLQFLASPSLMVGTAQLSTAEDLVRQGVDSGAALVAGDVAALSAVAGIALPIFGKSLGQRVLTGMAGNVATNIPEAAIKREVVAASGRADVAEQFDPWDMRARAVDLMLGAVFGVKAHIDANASQRDALLSVNAARHLEEVATPTRSADPVELTRGVENVRTAMEQMLRGEPVNVPYQDVMTAAQREANFAQWFGESKVVDDAGRPLVVYHGTSADFQAFVAERSSDGVFHFAIKPDMANTFAASRAMDGGGGANVIPVYLALRNPKEVDFINTMEIRQAMDGGFDGLISRARGHVVAFRAEQVKSAIGNSGRFDPESLSLTDPLPMRLEVEQLLAEELRPMTGEPIPRPDMTAPKGKPADLQAEMIQLRKTDAILARLLECIG